MVLRLPSRSVGRSLVALIVSLIVMAACTGEEAVPLDEPTTTTSPGAHALEPNDEMQRLAEQQCLDDPQLLQGEVRAVDPANPDQVLATVIVDCAEVR